VWTRRRSAEDERSWQPLSPSSRPTVSASPAAADHPWKKTPLILSALEALVEPETAGDPMSAQKWRSSLRTLSGRLKEVGHELSPPTVGRLLRKLDYSLRVNSKQLEARSNHPDRDVQFAHIDEQIATFTAAGQPIISVDSKKKELIGGFKQPGRTWSLEPIAVNIHDFLGDSLGRAVPYGIYDVLNNRGTVYVGSSADTPAFAVDAIAGWWIGPGQVAFPTAKQLLILAAISDPIASSRYRFNETVRPSAVGSVGDMLSAMRRGLRVFTVSARYGRRPSGR
jgi:Rhodopirellula transposase DDE domain